MTPSSVDLSSSSSTPLKKFEVFVSFRGEVRYTFFSHLKRRLKDRHVVTFYDEDDINYGDPINDTLLKAIESCKVAIILISQGYATSAWCLDEMVKIMECKEHGLIVIPVFFDVEPTVVRKCEPASCFGKAFAEHQLDDKKKAKVPIWKQNLMDVPGLSGEPIKPVRGRSEAKSITEIVDFVFKNIPIDDTAFTEKLVGMESRVGEIMSLLDKHKQSKETSLIGIHGIGGSGKTTAARYAFEKLRYTGFDGIYFLKDVRRTDDMVELQRTILYEFLQVRKEDVRDEVEGTSRMRNLLKLRRVLLVLDDVDKVEHLESLAGEGAWFGKGSVIIVTTRDVNLVKGTYHLFKVSLLTYKESFQLFCKHAFNEDKQCRGSFKELSSGFVGYARGLPLALKVIGSHLKHLPKSDWRSLLDSLNKKELPDDFEAKINSVLKISFAGLTPSQQKVFLDIACCFRGEKEEEVIEKINSFGLHTRVLNVLISKSLIHIAHVDYGEEVRKLVDMHDLIQEMGCRIVHQEANGRLERYSRLWLQKDVFEILSTYDTVIPETECLIVEENGLGTELANGLEKMNRLRFLEVYYSRDSEDVYCSDNGGTSPLNFFLNIILMTIISIYTGSVLPICMYLFALVSHRFFHPPPVSPMLPSRSLQWVNLKFYPSNDFPEYSNIWSKLACLKIQDSKLIRTPDFSDMPMLEILNLSGSKLLEELHESIGFHTKLKNVNLSMCTNLKGFPRIVKMESLDILDLSHTAIETVPEIQNAHRLRKLNLSCMHRLTCLPWYIGFATGLQELNLIQWGSMSMITLPASLMGLERLEILQIHNYQVTFSDEEQDEDNAGCNGNKELVVTRVSDFLSLRSLKSLVMPGCGVLELIVTEKTWLEFLDLRSNFKLVSLCLGQFSCLRELRLNDCNRLETIAEIPTSLTFLEMRGCIALKRMPNLLQLLNQNEHWRLLDLQDCSRFAKTSQCLLVFWDEEPVYNMLQKRKSLLQIFLPAIVPDCFGYQQAGDNVSVTLDSFCPSKIKGFVVVVFSSSTNDDYFEVQTPNKPLLVQLEKVSDFRRQRENGYLGKMELTGVVYIPINQIINGRNWKDDPYLFEVYTSASNIQRWGFHVVYYQGVGQFNSGLRVTIEEKLPEQDIVTDGEEEEERLQFREDACLSVKVHAKTGT